MIASDKANVPGELLDWVDENDQVVGAVSRSQAHEQPKIIHREIRVLLFDSSGRALVQKRSLKKQVYPGVWAEACQGHVCSGESYEEAAHKELQEELGFDTPLKLKAKTLVRSSSETHFAAWFVGQYQGEEIKLEPEEVESVALIEKKDLGGLEMIDSSRQMLEKLWPEA